MAKAKKEIARRVVLIEKINQEISGIQKSFVD